MTSTRIRIAARTIVILAAVVLGTLNTPTAQPQSKPATPGASPKFDVAAIKPNNSGAVWSSQSPIKDKVGRYSARNASLKSLLTWFYDVRDAQIAGGPRWLDSDRFDIDAEVDGQPSPQQSIEMLKALLADRFQLQIHFESRDLTRYVLATPKNGLSLGTHLAKADDRDCSATPAGTPGCRGTFAPGPQSLAMEHITFAALAITLSKMTGQLVTDETGLDGRYDIRLALTPSGTSQTVAYGDAVMEALRDQTGLRLESRKIPASVLVIDHAERPTGN